MKKSNIFTIVTALLIVAVFAVGIYILISTNDIGDEDSNISTSEPRTSTDRESPDPDMDDSVVAIEEEAYIRESRTNTRTDVGNNDSTGTDARNSSRISRTNTGAGSGNMNNIGDESSDVTNDSTNSTTPVNPPNNTDNNNTDSEKEDNNTDNDEEKNKENKDPNEMPEVEFCRVGARCRDENCSICYPIKVRSSSNTVTFNPKEQTPERLIGLFIDSKVDTEALNLSVYHKVSGLQEATAPLETSEAGEDWDKGMPTDAGTYDLLVFYTFGDDERGSLALSIKIEKAEISLNFHDYDDEFSYENKEIGESIDISGVLKHILIDFFGNENVEYNIKWYADDEEIEGHDSTIYTVRQEDAGKLISVAITCPNDKNFGGVHEFESLKIPFLVKVDVSGTYMPMDNDDVWIGTKENKQIYAYAEESIDIGYSLDSIYNYYYGYGFKDTLVWNGGSNLENITGRYYYEALSGTTTYTVDAEDVKNGVINIEAEFLHTGFMFQRQQSGIINLACWHEQQDITFVITQLGNAPIGQFEFTQSYVYPPDSTALIIKPALIESIPIGGSEIITVVVVPRLSPNISSTQYFHTDLGVLLDNNIMISFCMDINVQHTTLANKYNGDGTHSLCCKGCDYKEEPIACDGEWVVKIKATCLDNGEKVRTCIYCGNTETEAIDALGHDWGDWQISPPSCELEGEQTRCCSRCQDTEIEFPAALGHKMDVSIGVDATCEECGILRYECQRDGCDYYIEKIIDALGHNYVNDVCTACKRIVAAKPDISNNTYTVEWTVVSTDYPNEQNIIANVTIKLTRGNSGGNNGTLFIDGVQGQTYTLTSNGETIIEISLNTNNKESIDGKFIYALKLTTNPNNSNSDIFTGTLTIPLPILRDEDSKPDCNCEETDTCGDSCECEGCLSIGDDVTSSCKFCTEECVCLVERPELCDCKLEDDPEAEETPEGESEEKELE